jgi:diacylglycerol O-acyltransferase
MHRMSPLDASFLHLEDHVTQLHIGSVAIFEGPPPPNDEMLAMVLGKLPLVPRYRQVVRFVPLAMGRPVWVDDPHFNIEYHVRRTALPAPGGEQELRNLVGRVMSQHLDRAKPLWEMWIAEGMGAGRWALVSKVHHCMVDGVSGSDLLTVILDTERDPKTARPGRWQPEPAPSGTRLLADALLERTVSPYEVVRAMRASLRAPRQFARQMEDAARGLVGMRGLVRRTPPSSLNGPVGPHRRWSWARSQLTDVKAIRSALGGTVNDVVLACITNGFRQLLLARGESVDRVVRTMVPVSVRSPGERGTYNNRVSAMFAELPVGIENPKERLDSIRAQMEGLKESKQAVAGEVLTSLSGFAPPMLLALGERVATRVPQRNLNTVTTNVPGPQFPLYAAGRRMLEAFPYVPLGGRVRVGVAIFSYDGALNFGVTGDFDSAADVGVLCRGIEEGVAQLMKLAAPATAARAGRASRPAKPKVAAKPARKPRGSRTAAPRGE